MRRAAVGRLRRLLRPRPGYPADVHPADLDDSPASSTGPSPGGAARGVDRGVLATTRALLGTMGGSPKDLGRMSTEQI